MTDIVERLRDAFGLDTIERCQLHNDAIREIERLRGAIMKVSCAAYDDHIARNAAVKEVEKLRAENARLRQQLETLPKAGGAVIGPTLKLREGRT